MNVTPLPFSPVQFQHNWYYTKDTKALWGYFHTTYIICLFIRLLLCYYILYIGPKTHSISSLKDNFSSQEVVIYSKKLFK